MEQQPTISPQEFVRAVTQSDNLAADMDDGQLAEISQRAIADYEMDKDSMADWLQRMERGVELATLVKKEKNYPFKNASNVKYPLVTSAALQFNARAYPAIVPSEGVVKAKTWGADRDGLKAARGERISSHMSYQLCSKVEEWEAETDTLLVQLPIVGGMVRMWWYDPMAGRPKCKLVPAGKFIVNSEAKNLNEAPRATHEFGLYPNQIETKMRSGDYINFEYDTAGEDKHAVQDFIEQHTRLDLDEDGYDEPYIVTIHLDTKKVVRIIADFEERDVTYKTEPMMVPTVQMVPTEFGMEEIVVEQPQQVATGITSIRRGSYFVMFQFLPGMDGSIWGTGLGLLLGDISDAINTIINMMIDAGHYGALGGGFIGSEFRMKGGAQRLRPGEYRQVQARGGDVRSGIVPMQFQGADAVMFQMLGMLIEAGREIASVKDVMTGEQPRTNQTATTTMALIEQGMMVFTASYKRIFRALKAEYRMLAKINAETVTPEEYNAFLDEVDQQGNPVMFDPAEDYGAADMDVQPVADPASITKMQKAAKAQFVLQLAEAGMVDPGAATARMLEAMSIEDPDELAPQPDPAQAMMAKLQMNAAQADVVQKRADIELTLARVEKERAAATKDLAGVELEERDQQFKAVVELLKDERERLGMVIGSAARVAGQPGNNASSRGNGRAATGPQSSLLPGVSGGESATGSGQGSIAAR